MAFNTALLMLRLRVNECNYTLDSDRRGISIMKEPSINSAEGFVLEAKAIGLHMESSFINTISKSMSK